jgi:hypothetical protein
MHVPVPHHEIVKLVRYTLGFYGHEIAEEHHAVTQETSTMGRPPLGKTAMTSAER